MNAEMGVTKTSRTLVAPDGQEFYCHCPSRMSFYLGQARGENPHNMVIVVGPVNPPRKGRNRA